MPRRRNGRVSLETNPAAGAGRGSAGLSRAASRKRGDTRERSEQEMSVDGGARKKRLEELGIRQECHFNSDYFGAKDDSLRIEPGRRRRFGPLTKGLPRS